MSNHLIKTSLDWEVSLEPLTTEKTLLTTHAHAVVRSDNMKVLATCSSRYVPFTNGAFKDLVDQLAKLSGYKPAGFFESSGGREVMACLNTPEYDLCGQQASDYLLLCNRHDTSGSLCLGARNYIYRCTNEFTSKKLPIRWRHNKEIPLLPGRANLILQVFDELRTARNRDLHFAMTQRITDAIVYRFPRILLEEYRRHRHLPVRTDRPIQVPPALQQAIFTEVNDLGYTRWGLFNGVTRYTTALSRAPHRREMSRGKAQWLNQRAYELCTSDAWRVVG